MKYVPFSNKETAFVGKYAGFGATMIEPHKITGSNFYERQTAAVRYMIEQGMTEAAYEDVETSQQYKIVIAKSEKGEESVFEHNGEYYKGKEFAGEGVNMSGMYPEYYFD